MAITQISADVTHEWYDFDLSNKVDSVLLDGKPVQGCVTADAVNGWVDAVEKDEHGRLIIMGDIVLTRRMYGVVHIVLKGH